MISRTVARRYAKGLLEATLDEVESPEELEEVAEDLDGLARTIAGHTALEHLVINPAIDSAKKAAVFEAFAERMGLHGVLRRFLALLADKERLDHLATISEVFRSLVDEHKGVLTAEVTTPAALEQERADEIRGRLADATGRPVRLKTRVDPELLGGMRTRIGDIVYDGSLRSHLDRIRKELSSA